MNQYTANRVVTNEIEINYEETGAGEPVVLVHGSWSDHHNWDSVASDLAGSHRAIAYDRRGAGGSERVPGTRRDQEDDLAGLIERTVGGPAHVVGTSFGGSISIGLASRRPDLLRSLTVHEPPLLNLVADDPEVQQLLAPVGSLMFAVLDRVSAGDYSGGAKQFVEELAFGPNTWDLLPEPIKATMIDTAPAFLIEQSDSDWASIDCEALSSIDCPVLLTQGSDSPPWFPLIVSRLDDGIRGAVVHTYEGAGHAPHLSHPEEFVGTVTDFLAASMDNQKVRV